MTRYLQRLIARLTDNSGVLSLAPPLCGAPRATADYAGDPFAASTPSPPLPHPQPTISPSPTMAATKSEPRQEHGIAAEREEPLPALAERSDAPQLSPTFSPHPRPFRHTTRQPLSPEPASSVAPAPVLPTQVVGNQAPTARENSEPPPLPHDAPPSPNTVVRLQRTPNPPPTDHAAAVSGAQPPARRPPPAAQRLDTKGEEMKLSRQPRDPPFRSTPLAPPPASRPDGKPGPNERRPKPELRPPAVTTPPPVSREPGQPRIVIGRLSVEVAPAAPTTVQPDVRPARSGPSTPKHSEPSLSKLRFGLGQM